MTETFLAVGPLGIGLGFVRPIILVGVLIVVILIWWNRSRT